MIPNCKSGVRVVSMPRDLSVDACLKSPEKVLPKQSLGRREGVAQRMYGSDGLKQCQ